jgi:hypothetical protein
MPIASNRDKAAKEKTAKAGQPGKKLGGSRSATNETPVSSKEKPAPAMSKTGNTKDTRPQPKASAKAAPKPAAPAAKPGKAEAKSARPANDHTEATGRDHPSQSEHAHRLYEKLHGVSEQRTKVPGAGVPGKKGGFDPHQFRGNQKGFGGGNMMRRTQSRGGGSAGGGGGGGGGGA